jgi:hypothetical protein
VVWEAANHKKYGLGSSFSPRMLFGKLLITKNMVGEVANHQKCGWGSS